MHAKLAGSCSSHGAFAEQTHAIRCRSRRRVMHGQATTGAAGAGSRESRKSVLKGLHMQHVHMVVVHEVFMEELPVALERGARDVGQAAVFGVQHTEVALQVFYRLLEGLGLFGEVDEDAAAPDVQVDARQTAVRRIEVLGVLHVGRTGEAAVQVGGPAVIGALEVARIALPVSDLHAPVAAHVVERMDLALFVLGDEDRLAQDALGLAIARVLVLLHPADEQPVLHEVLLHFELVHLGRGVDVARYVAGPLDFRLVDADIASWNESDRLGFLCHERSPCRGRMDPVGMPYRPLFF